MNSYHPEKGKNGEGRGQSGTKLILCYWHSITMSGV
jgi:hypothetical protein